MLTYRADSADALKVDAVESLSDVRQGATPAIIGEDLRLSTAGLERYFFQQWQPNLVDLLVVAAAAEYCDAVKKRTAWGWARAFDVRVAVHDPDLWNSTPVKSALEEALSFLTGDRWNFQFATRAQPVPQVRERFLEFGPLANAIMPYSSGLDSLATAILISREANASLVRVRLGSATSDQKAHNRRREPFTAVPYKVRIGKRQRRESSARSRGFKFAVVTGIAANLAGVDRIIVTESGQGALGPVLTVSGQAYPDYRVHPAFTSRVELLFTALTGKSAHYIFPRLWHTKGETIAAAAALSPNQVWNETRSCWQQARQVGIGGRLRQCGICAACMLRRVSMHTAGLPEPADTYVWENLTASDFKTGAANGFGLATKALEQYAIAGVLHLDHIAALPDSHHHQALLRRVSRETAHALGDDVEETEMKLRTMLKKHRAEWHAFLKFLGPESFVAKLSSATP